MTKIPGNALVHRRSASTIPPKSKTDKMGAINAAKTPEPKACAQQQSAMCSVPMGVPLNQYRMGGTIYHAGVEIVKQLPPLMPERPGEQSLYACVREAIAAIRIPKLIIRNKANLDGGDQKEVYQTVEHDKLKKKVEKIKTHNQNLEKKLSLQDKEIRQHSKDKERFTLQATKLKHQLDLAEKLNLSHQAKISSLRSALRKATDEAKKDQSDMLLSLMKSVDALQEDKKQLESKVASLEGDKSDLLAQATKDEGRIKLIEKTKKDAEARLAQEKRASQNLKREARDYQDRINSLETTSQEKSGKIRALTKEVEKSSQAATMLSTDNLRLSRKVEPQADTIKVLTNTVRELESELSSLRESHEHDEVERQQLDLQKSEMLQCAQQQVDNLRDENNRLSRSNRHLAGNNTLLLSANGALHHENMVLMQNNGELIQRLAPLESMLFTGGIYTDGNDSGEDYYTGNHFS